MSHVPLLFSVFSVPSVVNDQSNFVSFQRMFILMQLPCALATAVWKYQPKLCYTFMA